MQIRELGRTGLCVGRLGLGGIPIQRTNASAAVSLLNTAEEQQVNFIDTARGYSVSESYFGAALKGRRDRFIIATKSMAKTKADMARDIELSLNTLGTEYIDLYQLHNPSLQSLPLVFGENGALSALLEAKKAGKIGHIGASAHETAVFERLLDREEIETILFPCNPIETQGDACIASCAARGKGFLAMKPLAGGAIQDASLAMRYLMNRPAVDVILVGMGDAEELTRNAQAMNDLSPLSNDELTRIEQIRKELSGAFCRRCGYCAPCAQGVDVRGVLLFLAYHERYDLHDWAQSRYDCLPVKASACVKCGACESRCPYGLPIREMLERAVKAFESN